MTHSSPPAHALDFLAIGEALIDLISIDISDSLAEVKAFERFPGGQPANLTRNMALLGNRAALSACLGDDSYGELIQEQLRAAGVNTGIIQITSQAPTTMVTVTRTSNGTPDFTIYRGADAHLTHTPELTAAAANSQIIHTSAFALSCEPTRSIVLEVIRVAHEQGRWIALDPNYHPRIWPDTPNFLDILQDAYQYVCITKPSIEDCQRIFGAGLTPSECADRFLEWGAKIVAITMGVDGVYLATEDHKPYQIFANQIPVADVTGAGDAFWSGFLTALLRGASSLEAACLGQTIAELKIGTIGPLSNIPDLKSLLKRSQQIKYHIYDHFDRTRKEVNN